MRKICCNILGLWLVTSCLHTENARDRKQSGVYADYRIWGEEGREAVTCLFRFYEGGPEGASLVLGKNSISIDGIPMVAGSARQTGAFYEFSLPLQDVEGPHTILFRDDQGNEYREAFDFRRLYISPELDAVQRRGSFTIGIAGVKEMEPVRVILTDTSFATADINEWFPVVGGKVRIGALHMINVASGPLNLHLFREEDRPLKNPPAGGGTISISYGLQRSFELADF